MALILTLRPRIALATCLGLTALLTLAASAAPSTTGTGIAKEELETIKGEVGIAVIDVTRNKKYLLNESKAFPMHSVCKLPVSLAILKLADTNKLSLQEKVTLKEKDVLPDMRSPIKEAIKAGQHEFTLRNLMTWAICDSDNTACDVLIGKAGGAPAVNQVLTETGVRGVRIDRPETEIQPDSLKISKFLADPRDTATPAGVVDMLQKLNEGKLLSKDSTALVLADLFNSKTGLHRLTAGLPAGWKLGHKTGTGRDVGDQNAGTNDVGIMVGPKGETIYVAVFLKGSRAKAKVREALMAKVAARAAAGTL